MSSLDGLTPLTELEAVNVILATTSSSPISTLDENEITDASLARNTLRATLVEVQTQGLSFNTETNYKITPDQTGMIILPRNTLKVDTDGSDATINVVQRGTKLYNKDDHTYIWTKPVSLEITLGFPFEELPPYVANYCVIRAARKYQDQYFGDGQVHSFTEQDELVARASLMDAEIDLADPNMLTDSQFMQGLLARR
ncbi:hypothetical protein [Rhizobium leguminosarum]|uniref:hypothetical protein n=1 Tax=Rhizobium leguminosarum TaxID=384 RepID=UPI001C97E947|nr:hypothetical protein [Rhizobium leguminosarum]MBY5581856.1 hypothetical protein [Rhizobium leguminosarum]